jgi:hypothetical protein
MKSLLNKVINNKIDFKVDEMRMLGLLTPGFSHLEILGVRGQFYFHLLAFKLFFKDNT